MTAVSSTVASNRNENISWCSPPEYLECSPPVKEIERQEYRRLITAPFNPSLTQFKNLKKEIMTNGDKVALGIIVAGTGFLIGGPVGLAAGALLLTGCYGLDSIESAGNQQDQHSDFFDVDGGREMQPGQNRETPDQGPSSMPYNDPCEGMPPQRSYSGSEGTVGVGICQEKIRTCSDGVYQRTQEEVLPQVEIPHDGIDNDCDGITDSDSWIQVSTGEHHACGIRTDHTIECWGLNYSGESSSPSGAFQTVSAGSSYSCGIRMDGTVDCWGSNMQGESIPPTGTFIQIGASGIHTCGLRADNMVACWGYNRSGESDPPGGSFIQLAVEAYYNCGIRSDHTVGCWGDNITGQSNSPRGSFEEVTTGFYHACGIKTDGTLSCWGSNIDNRTIPPIETYVHISASSQNTCGIKTDGTITCWGSNEHGESSPPAGIFSQIGEALGYTFCGIKPDDTIECWGNNSDGQATPPSP